MGAAEGLDLAVLGALAPIVRAEQRRGNRARILVHESQLRGDPPRVHFKYPMDREALAVEFDFGSRVVEVGGPDTTLTGLGDARTGCRAYDGHGRRGWWARRLTADWWREWDAAPRPRVRLEEIDAP